MIPNFKSGTCDVSFFRSFFLSFFGCCSIKILEKLKNINKKGLYVADDIDYNIRQGKKESIIKKYKDLKDEADQEVERARNLNGFQLKEEENKIAIPKNNCLFDFSCVIV